MSKNNSPLRTSSDAVFICQEPQSNFTMECYKKKEVLCEPNQSDSFAVDNPSFSTLLLLNSMTASWKAVSERTLSNPSAQTLNSLAGPAVNAWRPLAYASEDGDPTQISKLTSIQRYNSAWC